MSSPASSQPSISSMTATACYLGLVTALIMLGSGLAMLGGYGESPMPLAIALLIAGAIQGAVCTLTLRRNRAAWAFALSLNGTLGLVFLFGAPKVRDSLESSLVIGLLPCVAFAVITILLALNAEE